jgi:hypothetical protein
MPRWVRLGLWLLTVPFTLTAQTPLNNAVLGAQVANAERYLRSFKNDSALLITSKLLRTVQVAGRADTPVGLAVQFAHAWGLEQDQRDEAAIAHLLPVVARSQAMQQWTIHARACLTLALLYEKLDVPNKSLTYLNRAQATIESHELAAVYPYFAIRMASWQRIFGDKQQALYYAKEALRTAPAQQLTLETAIGHMLMTMLLPKTALFERLAHSYAGLRLYQQLADYTGASSMYRPLPAHTMRWQRAFQHT